MPGIRSRLPVRFGTQKLWMTSRDIVLSTTGTPTGMCSSFGVLTRSDGLTSWYWNSHHHWWPTTSIVTAPGPEGDVSPRPATML